MQKAAPPTTPTPKEDESQTSICYLKPPRLNVDDLIVRILNVGATGASLVRTVKEEELIELCSTARDVFLQQPSLLELEPPIRVCGDTHGQYADVLRILGRGGFPPTVNYLFLGGLLPLPKDSLADYVDRGHQNLEVIALFFCYKIRFPLNFFLLRGNHECAGVNRIYGFFEECNRRYQSLRLWNAFQDTFNSMPLVALIGQRILCMHGGLSPKLTSLDQLRKGWQPNARGVSYVFGDDIVNEINTLLELDLIARAHQVVQDGYEFFANRKLVTIFSAPHYCGQFDNAAAWMAVDDDLTCSFQILRPTTKLVRAAPQG